MSVPSWRFLSFSREGGGTIFWFTKISVFALGLALLASLPACIGTTRVIRFNTEGLTKPWKQADAECDYEASKATASIRSSFLRDHRWEELYVQCMELNGAKFKVAFIK